MRGTGLTDGAPLQHGLHLGLDVRHRKQPPPWHHFIHVVFLFNRVEYELKVFLGLSKGLPGEVAAEERLQFASLLVGAEARAFAVKVPLLHLTLINY